MLSAFSVPVISSAYDCLMILSDVFSLSFSCIVDDIYNFNNNNNNNMKVKEKPTSEILFSLKC